MNPVRYHPKADDEVLEAARFYETRSKGLGWRFLRLVMETETRIARNPSAYPVLEDDIRRCIVRGFPISLFFRVDEEGILVVAIAHQSRRPGYWRRRARSRA